MFFFFFLKNLNSIRKGSSEPRYFILRYNLREKGFSKTANKSKYDQIIAFCVDIVNYFGVDQLLKFSFIDMNNFSSNSTRYAYPMNKGVHHGTRR